MKYLKTYNERLGDKLSAPNEDDVLDTLIKKKKYIKDILSDSMLNYFLKGVIYACDNEIDYSTKLILQNNIYYTSPDIIEYLLNNNKTKNFYNDNVKYILEKYSLGLHQNEEREYETWFKDILLNSKPLPSEDKEFIYYKNEEYGLTLLHTTKTANIFNINSNIWKILITKFCIDSNITYDASYASITYLIRNMIMKYYNEKKVVVQKYSL